MGGGGERSRELLVIGRRQSVGSYCFRTDGALRWVVCRSSRSPSRSTAGLHTLRQRYLGYDGFFQHAKESSAHQRALHTAATRLAAHFTSLMQLHCTLDAYRLSRTLRPRCQPQIQWLAPVPYDSESASPRPRIARTPAENVRTSSLAAGST